MAQKRRQYVKTSTGIVEQLIASAADIVSVEAPSDGSFTSTNVQDALEEIAIKAATGGVTSVAGKTGAVTLEPKDVGLSNVTNDKQVKASEKGVAGGVATLDDAGKVPTSQLPSYVDDIIEGYYLENSTGGYDFYRENDNNALNRITPETSKIYVDLNTNKTYRYGGIGWTAQYVEISSSLALGETSSTAYAGNKGKANADNIAKIVDGTTPAGKATKADQLTTARTISLKGDATGSTTFDGSANKEISLTLANSGVTAGTYSAVTVNTKGLVTDGGQIIEWGTRGQTSPSADLAEGGLFFAYVE